MEKLCAQQGCTQLNYVQGLLNGSMHKGGSHDVHISPQIISMRLSEFFKGLVHIIAPESCYVQCAHKIEILNERSSLQLSLEPSIVLIHHLNLE